MTDRKTIRDVVDDLLKENEALRAIVLALRPTRLAGEGDAVKAARALLRDLDSLDVRITQYLIETMRSPPYDLDEESTTTEDAK